MTARSGVILILVVILCTGCASPGVSPASTSSEATPPAASPPPGAHAGLRVYKDPQTGAFTDRPPGTTVPIERALNRSHEGLTAVPNTAVPGGGVKMDLQGRFRSHFTAVKDADGKVSIRCVPEHELPKP